MPPREIRAVLAADDAIVAQRILELHRERLEEWLEQQRSLIEGIERSLAAARGGKLRGGSNLVNACQGAD